MLKKLFLFLVSLIFPPLGIFLILKGNYESLKPTRAKINLSCILIALSVIFWVITFPKVYYAYDSYRKPLTAETNEKHRQSIENLYDEFSDIANDISINGENAENQEELTQWRNKLFEELTPSETREEFSEIHEKAYHYFINLYFNTDIPNGDTKYNVSEEKQEAIELYMQAVINSNDDEAAALIQVIDSDSPLKKETSAPVENIFSTDVTPSAVRNDVTGNWKKVLISEDIAIQEKALDYYNTYFDSKKEIHAIINFANNTTTKFSVLGNLLDVTIYEYVNKEEHDAKILFSGQLLAEYFVNMDTGEIEQIQ